MVNKFGTDTSYVRIEWVIKQLKDLPEGLRILDAGAGERRFKPFCDHLKYVSRDFGEYMVGVSHTVFILLIGIMKGLILFQILPRSL